jgi:hypothetical protein
VSAEQSRKADSFRNSSGDHYDPLRALLDPAPSQKFTDPKVCNRAIEVTGIDDEQPQFVCGCGACEIEDGKAKDRVMWIVGSYRGTTMDGTVWQLAGVFDSEAAAVAACVDGDDFIGPCPLNQALPHNRMKWPGCRYPLAEAAA